MMLRNRRKMLGATAVVLGMVVVPMVTLSGESVVHAAAPACSPTSPANLGALCVESSTDGASDNPYHTGIVKGQSIGDYKWLVNEDTTGDPSFSDANVAACLPLRARPNPPVDPNVNPVLAKYNGAGGGQLSDCPWPSVHASSGHAPVIASGDATNEQNIANLSTRGDRKYLLSVTAGGYKIDGVHFEVRGGGLYSTSRFPIPARTGSRSTSPVQRSPCRRLSQRGPSTRFAYIAPTVSSRPIPGRHSRHF